jgi:REP element-mobilizing transposase RayT
MRKGRLKLPSDQAAAWYHCISRVIQRQFLFGPDEKEQFVRILREYEDFCEVRILTYCLMSNHFHILVEVPKRANTPLTAEELIAKLKRLSCEQGYGWVQQQIELYRKNHDGAGEQRFLQSFAIRMRDVSWFIRLVKQRFSGWYNRRNARKGTLWEERFKSVVVEGAGEALAAMAAYIDLNPVRGGLVSDPKDYRWCGYGEAVAGRKRAKLGVEMVVSAMRGRPEGSLSKSLEAYRMRLFNDGHEQREMLREDGTLERGAFSHETVLEVLRTKGRLPMTDYLRARVRYFCDGTVFGSRGFVEGIFGAYRGRFGPKRKNGARRLRGLQTELYALRDLRVDLFG